MDRAIGLETVALGAAPRMGQLSRRVRCTIATGGQAGRGVLHGWPQTWYMWRDVLPAMMQSGTRSGTSTCAAGDLSRPATWLRHAPWRRTSAPDDRGADHFHAVAHDKWSGAYACRAARPGCDVDGHLRRTGARRRLGTHGDGPLALVSTPKPTCQKPWSKAARGVPAPHVHQGRWRSARPVSRKRNASTSAPIPPRRDARRLQLLPRMGDATRATTRASRHRRFRRCPFDGLRRWQQSRRSPRYALDSWQTRVRLARCAAAAAEGCGHWIPEEAGRCRTAARSSFPRWTQDCRRGRRSPAACKLTALHAPNPAPTCRQGPRPCSCDTTDTALIDAEALPWMPFAPLPATTSS